MNKDSSRFFLITGPNMGGKSTFIRQAALIALMNQIGMYVPCSKAKLPVFDALMCRVGASDLQLRGLSTFMAEMLEASCILKTATPRTLVLVDELGRGTSTFDGFGLAWAIACHLLNKTKCFCLFATHFQELSNLSAEQKGCVNRYVDATINEGQLTFQYEIKDGFVDQSYGVHVAKMADFPERVVGNAKRKADELEGKSDELDLDESCKKLKALIQSTAVDDFNTFLGNLPTVLGSLRTSLASAA
jgi:DNA mismatch repair protein MSH2